MSDKTFNLIDAINRCGIDNSQWGVCENVPDTSIKFGTKSILISLEGRWIYAYTDDEGVNPISEWSPKVVPDLVMDLDEPCDPKAKVVFYKLD